MLVGSCHWTKDKLWCQTFELPYRTYIIWYGVVLNDKKQNKLLLKKNLVGRLHWKIDYRATQTGCELPLNCQLASLCYSSWDKTFKHDLIENQNILYILDKPKTFKFQSTTKIGFRLSVDQSSEFLNLVVVLKLQFYKWWHNSLQFPTCHCS